jgi:hypothetical protein
MKRVQTCHVSKHVTCPNMSRVTKHQKLCVNGLEGVHQSYAPEKCQVSEGKEKGHEGFIPCNSATNGL